MDIKQILRLHAEGKSQRSISKYLNIHRQTIAQCIKSALCSGFSFEEILAFDDQSLEKIYVSKNASKSAMQEELERYFDLHKKDHKCTGFTIENHWRTYTELVPDGLCRSQFYSHFKSVFKAPKGSFKIEHSYGAKLFIDFTGKHLFVTDSQTGISSPVEIFVGILPASQYIYVQAVHSQSLTDLVDCTSKCLAYMGGVPQSITTDNLKAAVNKASKTEPVLNKTFKDLAYHYQTTVTPTRSYSPKDKAMVEGAVRIVYCSIFYALRHQIFYSINELNEAILKSLAHLNTRQLSNKTISRLDQFKEEQPYLKALPIHLFELWNYNMVTVQKMGYIYSSKYKSYYSVPFRFIGKQIQIRTNSSCLEAYYKSELIATHLINRTTGSYTTIKSHLHRDNQFLMNWTPSFFVKEALKIGVNTASYVKTMIEKSDYPEIGYKSAIAILALRRSYPVARIEKACLMAIGYPKHNCGIISTILKNNSDLVTHHGQEQETTENIQHKNLRGPACYW